MIVLAEFTRQMNSGYGYDHTQNQFLELRIIAAGGHAVISMDGQDRRQVRVFGRPRPITIPMPIASRMALGKGHVR
jgi:hypothetical protein